MKIRTKITLYLGPFMLFIICGFFVSHYYVIRTALVENARSELFKMEKNIHRAAQALLSTAINNYLRGITEKNLDYIKLQYDKFIRGELTEHEAKEAIQNHFNTQPVGDSGYLVAVEEKDNKLFLNLHPFLVNVECSDTEGCQAWANTRNGYTEYLWKNPADNSYRKKAAYVQEFPEWNWIVGASSYRNEFVKLVEVEDLSRFISPIKIHTSGYFYVFDEKLDILIHPEFKNINVGSLTNSRGENIIQLLLASENGYLEYYWKNPSEDEERLKFAFVDKLEGYNWYLVASGYMSEVYEPIASLKRITLFMACLSSLVLIVMIFRLSKYMSAPLWQLKSAIDIFYKEKKTFLWNQHPIEEIHTLGTAFSRMTNELKISLEELQKKNEQLDASKKSKEQNNLYLQSILNSMSSVIVGIDRKMHITQWNIEAAKETGLSAEAVKGKLFFDVFDWLQEYQEMIKNSLDNNVVSTITDQKMEGKKTASHYDIKVYPLVSSGNVGAVVRMDNITEQVEMELRLRQSQKMDAVGQLAGGIAHDFNNMLSGIVGAAELLRLKVGKDEQRLVRIITEASLRAGELIQKLLAFSRKDTIAFVPMDMHTVIHDTTELLKRTLDKRITIKLNLNAEVSTIQGDWSQLQSCLLNIGINAGHAMPDGGILSFTTSTIELEEGFRDTNNLELTPGQFLQIEIRDTGIGIEEEHLKHIFEPFFTTREQDKGTGLGLAAVYGAVKQHRGAITVYSEKNKGTYFTLYLPISEAEGIVQKTAERLITGEGSILIIDDEPIVRTTAKMILTQLGYTILEAENGKDGVEVFRKNQNSLDLVLLDMLMPEMDGTECFYELKKIDATIPVLICSGFTRDADLTALREHGLAGFVRKPHNMLELSRTVSSVLNKNSETH